MNAAQIAYAPSMEPQPFCSLPWCGRAPGGPNKRYRVGGKILEYPALIDAHHVAGRPGPVVYLCHECHMAQHQKHRDTFDHINGEWVVMVDGGYRPLRVFDTEESA